MEHKNSNKVHTVKLIEDGEDLIMPIPQEILDELDMKEGDMLEWINNQDGTFSLVKSQQQYNSDSGLTENLE